MHDIGNFQSRLLLTVFYFTILAPFALVLRMASDPLQRRPRATSWVEWPPQASARTRRAASTDARGARVRVRYLMTPR